MDSRPGGPRAGALPKRPLPGVPLTEIETTLLDGTPVDVRPIQPSDRDALREMFEGLSEQSRYRRFLGGAAELTDAQLDLLMESDFRDHQGWVAFRRGTPDGAIGLGQSVRVEGEPEVAEAAITVADEYQNRGLGTLLLAVLAISARASGILRFRAYVLEQNLPMRDVLEHLGVQLRFDSPGLLVVDMPLDLDDVTDSTAGRALKAFATRLMAARSAAPRRPAAPR